jgi:ribulose-phosphate 3-epimerase
MIQEPERFISAFAQAGADILTVHAEACVHLHRVVHLIKEAGLRAGVALNPATPLSAVEEVLPDLDLVLAMTVNPGFPGQPFLASVVPKVARLRQLLDERDLPAELEVDGGIGPTTAGSVVRAGARILVAGSAVFSSRDGIRQAIATIRERAQASL